MQVDWSKAPKWAKWHAFDENGRGYWYGGEPHRNDELNHFSSSDRFSRSGHHDPDARSSWKQSKAKRPDQAETVQDTTQQILSERGSRYGKFSDLSSIDQALKSVMHQAPNWGSLEPHHKTALEMIQHKVSRILNGDPDYDDNWIDIEGYSRLGREPNQ